MPAVMNCNLPRIYPRLAHADVRQGRGPAPLSPPDSHALDESDEPAAPARAAFTSALAGDLDLQVTYAIDSPTASELLTPQRLADLGLDPQALHAQAVGNLLRKAGPNIATQDLTVYKALVTGDGLEACMLLLPELWARLSEGFNGELIAAVPSQSALYFMDSRATLEIAGEPISTATMLELMCASAARVKAEAGAQALSDKVIALTPEGWKVRGTFEAHASALGA